MRVVVQRVSEAKIIIDSKIRSQIGVGILALVGISASDSADTTKWMANKLANLRIFPDENDKMNKSVLDISGGILLVSNFTLLGNAQKGFRPSFIEAAHPDFAKPYFENFVKYMRNNYEKKIIIGDGVFGAMMDIELTNYGPVTVIIDK